MAPNRSHDAAAPSTGGPAQEKCSETVDGIGAVYLTLRDELARFLRARTGSADEATEILQDLWIKVRTPAKGPIANPRAYLYRMAQNLVLDRRRETQRRARREQQWQDQTFGRPSGGEELADQRGDTESALIRQEEGRRLADAIEALPQGARRAFRLHKIDGLPHAEVAEQLGISRSGVEKHIALAMTHLRRLLHD